MKVTPTHRQSPGQASSRRLTHAAPQRFLNARVLALGALAALLVAGCSAGGTASTDTSGAAGPASGGTVSGYTAQDNAQRNSAPEAKAGAAVAPGASADLAKPGSAVVAVGPKLTKSASLDLRVKDVAAAAARVRSIAVGLQAMVLSEQIGGGGPGEPKPLPNNGRTPSGTSDGDLTGFGTLTLSVPSDKLDAALDQLSKVGTVLRRNTTSQDVTAHYVDTESRLKTMRASVERVRALMAQAKDIGQVVALESEMSRREADLESLESQLAALKDDVERSTVALSLSTPASLVEPAGDDGFLAGLRSGWDAFATSAAGLFKGIGAVLPFALFFALVGAPLAWWLRRRMASRPAASPTPSGPAPTGTSAGPASA